MNFFPILPGIWGHWCCSGDFNVNFKHISHMFEQVQDWHTPAPWVMGEEG